MLMGDREFACVDKFGHPLAGGVQVVRNCTIPGHSRATIHCRVSNSQISGLGVVEGAHARIQLASSLNRLCRRGEILVQCVNPFSEAVKLPSWSVLGRFHSVQEENIGPSLGDATEGPQQRQSQERGTVPPHIQELYETACDGCVSNGERQVMAKLLRKYNDVPHRGDHDAGLNRAVRHEVPLVAGAVPIRQPMWRLGPRKRKRDRGPPWNEYDWDQGQLQQKAGTPPEVVQNLRANPVLAGNVRELQKLQENLPGVVADVYRAKKEGRRPSEKQLRQGCAELRLYRQRWDSLRIGPDGLLTMTLAANSRHPTRERVVCPAAIRRKLIRNAHQQAHTGIQRVLTKLQLRWYWPNMGRDVRRRVRQSKSARPASIAVSLVKRDGERYMLEGLGKRRLSTWSKSCP